MSFWRPSPSLIRYLFLLLPVLSIALVAWLWTQLGAWLTGGVYDFRVFLAGLSMFLALVLAAMSAYLAWCAFTMSYRLDRRSLRIRCGGVSHVVPIESMRRVYKPGDLVNGHPVSVRWDGGTVPLPGYVVGTGRSDQLGRVLAVATAPAERQVFVVTDRTTFGLSPASGAELARELQTRLSLYGTIDDEEDLAGVRHEAPLRSQARGVSAWGAALWDDRAARFLLVGGLAICVILFGYVSLVYEGLPDNIPFHWNIQGQPDIISSPKELLRLPIFALTIWLFNAVVGWLVLNRERAATLFLLAGAAAAQVAFLAGVLSIVLRG